jgi:hypothetical protein
MNQCRKLDDQKRIMFIAVVVVSRTNGYPCSIDFAGQQDRCTSLQIYLDHGVHVSRWRVSP